MLGASYFAKLKIFLKNTTDAMACDADFLKDDVKKILKSRILETIVDGETVSPLQERRYLVHCFCAKKVYLWRVTNNCSGMKKIFTILMTLAAVATFVSCGELDDLSGEKTLAGTSWVANPEEGVTMTIAFTTGSDCQISASVSTDVIKGTYVYNDPNVSITAKDLDSGQPQTLNGKINGNKMTLTDPEEPSETMVFTKK